MRMLLVAALAALAACGDERAAPAARADAAPMFGTEVVRRGPADEARAIWQSGCATCHGPEGRGDAPMAANLSPRPRDHSDPAWQDSVTDVQIAEVIVRGGAAVGKSASMPPRADLADKPDVVAELVKMIRGFRR